MRFTFGKVRLSYPSTCHIFTSPCTVSGQPLMSICLASTLTISVWNSHKTPISEKTDRRGEKKLCIQEPFQDELNENHNGGWGIFPKPWNGIRAILTQQQKPSQAMVLVNPFWAWDFLRSGTLDSQWAAVQAYWWFLRKASQNLKLH